MKKYILTGAPGCGKSSIAQRLDIRYGEHVIREAAEDYIRMRQAEGQKQPWTDSDFQQKILELQIQRDARVPKDAARVFIDRGYEDGLAYSSEKALTENIRKAGGSYTKVFLIENLGSTNTNEVRRENHEEAMRLEKRFEEIYKAKGYEVVRIPSTGLAERVQKILEEL